MSKSSIIVPDTAHWATWIDAAIANDPNKRAIGRNFEERLEDAKRIPVLSMHHIEELLSIDDESWALKRIEFLAELKSVSWLSVGITTPGSILDIIAAEAIAVLSGAKTIDAVRHEVRTMFLNKGSGQDVIGKDMTRWSKLFQDFRNANINARSITSICPEDVFDSRRTIGEIIKGRIRTPAEQISNSLEIRERLIQEISDKGDQRIVDPTQIADYFINEMKKLPNSNATNVHDLIVEILVSQGVKKSEITEDMDFADLNMLAFLRKQLQTLAELPKCLISFDELQAIPTELFLHHQLYRLLKMHGQKRSRRSGSDLNDFHLLALAPFVDEIYVDKRTAEDFLRVTRREPEIMKIVGHVGKASNFEGLLFPPVL